MTLPQIFIRSTYILYISIYIRYIYTDICGADKMVVKYLTPESSTRKRNEKEKKKNNN